ncbi:MAG: ABC transporter ATP-binding protein [Pikeienuella sp.]|uniref:ABC transporter ATP-binding protein n=1 Tax=Pikeienuella sp. TaxID=2831957 RepID=UPI00391C2B28
MGILIEGVVKRFGGAAVVDGVSLEAPEGAFTVVVGPSGCGKSTLLRLIAGLERPEEGRIALGGRTVSGPGLHTPPEARQVGVVFQSYALWPHMSVLGNVAFPGESAGMGRAAAREAAEAHLRAVSLEPFAARKPAELSGGQRQRVALARCLAQGARTILMDEPLANLDPHLRAAMEEELADFHRRTGATTLFITHDQREAMALADRIAVMEAGRFLQVGAPEEVYERPASARVAAFIGKGALLPCHVEAASGGRAALRLAGRALEAACAVSARPGPARLLVRPESFSLAEEGMPARIVSAAYRGGHWEAMAALDGVEGAAPILLPRRPVEGEKLSLRLSGGWVLPE